MSLSPFYPLKLYNIHILFKNPLYKNIKYDPPNILPTSDPTIT